MSIKGSSGCDAFDSYTCNSTQLCFPSELQCCNSCQVYGNAELLQCGACQGLDVSGALTIVAGVWVAIALGIILAHVCVCIIIYRAVLRKRAATAGLVVMAVPQGPSVIVVRTGPIYSVQQPFSMQVGNAFEQPFRTAYGQQPSTSTVMYSTPGSVPTAQVVVGESPGLKV